MVEALFLLPIGRTMSAVRTKADVTLRRQDFGFLTPVRTHATTKDISFDWPRWLPDVELGQLHWARSYCNSGKDMRRREFITALGPR